MKVKIAQQITQKNAVNDHQYEADPWPRAAENNDINFIKDRQTARAEIILHVGTQAVSLQGVTWNISSVHPNGSKRKQLTLISTASSPAIFVFSFVQFFYHGHITIRVRSF